MNFLIFLAIIFTSFSTFSQEAISVSYKLKPLKEVLTDIEKKTDLLFSYSDEVVKDKFITLVNTSITKAHLLSELTNQTKLKLEKVSDTQIVISLPSSKIDICGYLFDAETKESLPFASLVVKGSFKGSSSDENGFFQIKNVEQQAIITIQYIGYASMEAEAANLASDDCARLFLQAQSHALQEVVLLEYVTKGIDRNADGALSLTSEKLGILPGLVEPDVLQSLQLIPGISSLDESASGIQIRGGSPDQNLIYFDGIKMYNTGHFFGMISAINPYVVKTAKVYKGGASPEYGDRISGVIDISSDKDVPEITEAGIGVNGTHADAFLKSPLGENVGLVVSARRSYTDMIQTPTFNALSEKVFQNTKIISNNTGQIIGEDDDDDFTENVGKEDFFFYDGNAKLIIQVSENDNIAISGLFTNNDLDFSIRDDEDVSSDKLVVEKQGASFSWLGTRFGKLHHSLKAYYSNLDSDYNNQITEDLELEEKNIRRNTVEDYGIDINFSYYLTTLSAIKAGYQYSNTNVFFQLFRSETDEEEEEEEDEEDEEVNIPTTTTGGARDFNVNRKGTNHAHSIYAEYVYKPKNNGLLSLGVRRSYYSSVDDVFIEPRLNAEYPLSKSLRIKATAEKRYQPISQLIEFEDTQLKLENSIWTLSDNSRIPVLESLQFSGGILVNKNGWTLDIDAYLKKIEGLTSFTNGFTNAAEKISEGKSDISGFDILVRKKIGSYRAWLGYTFNDVKYTFHELQSNPFNGNNDITHNFRISNTYELKNWQFSLGWTYRTGSPYTPTDGFNSTTGEVNFGSVNSLRLPNYHRLDASVLYKFFSSESKFRGVIGASLQNIYSRQIPLSVHYRVDANPDTGKNELNRVQQLSLGFTPNFSFRLYF